MNAPHNGLRTLSEALNEGSTTRAGYVFLTEAGARQRTYAELRVAACGVAAALLAAGLCRGDVVALVISDAEEFLTTLFGATIAGLIPASLYPPSTTGDLPQFFETTTATLMASTARAVITTAALVAGFEALRDANGMPELVLTRQMLDTMDQAPLPDTWMPSLDDVALVQFTSGSTSSPKGVVLTHRALASNIEAIKSPAGLGITTADSGVSWLPLYHDMGLVGMSLCALYSRNPAVLMTPEMFVKRPVEWLRTITHYRGTVSFAPNFAYDLCARRVKERDLAGLDLSSWRVAGCGAEPVHAGTLKAFAEKFAPVGFRETSFLPSYGLAEHVLAATFPPRERAPRVDVVSAQQLADGRVAVPATEDESADGRALRLVSCGRMLPGHALRIVRDDGRAAAECEVGEIVLSGPSMMLGYYKDDTLTARTIRDGWLHTGDLGYLTDGELFVCGRSKDLIIVNGRKYHPQDLEWAVDGLAGLRRGRVVAFGTLQPVEDLRVANGAECVVIVAEPSGTVPAEVVVASVRQRIGDLFGLTIGEVALVPSGTIGRTTSGKVQRAAMRTRYERGELPAVARPAGLHS